MPLSENRGIEKMLLETSERCRGFNEVQLPLIVEADQCPHVLDGFDAYPPDRQAQNER